jgi:hypothetical protein
MIRDVESTASIFTLIYAYLFSFARLCAYLAVSRGKEMIERSLLKAAAHQLH